MSTSRWSAIASHLPGRTDNEIKNFWNTHLKKKLIQMGFDPMTHQPRTDDLFSSLTHLLALANLRNLMEHHSLDDHSLKIQADAIQLAKLQYLEYLLQSTVSASTNSYSPNGIANMEAFSFSSSSIPPMKENPVLSSLQLENLASFSLDSDTSQPRHHPSPLAHLTAPQVPFQTPLNSEMGQTSNPNSPWVLPSPSTTLPPLVTNLSMNHPGEGSSISSYGGGPSPYWSELFEDHLMHDDLS